MTEQTSRPRTAGPPPLVEPSAWHEIELEVNGEQVRGQVESRLLLVDFLRHRLALTGTHVGCEQGSCGACTILIDGQAARSCLTFAVQADGARIRTVESLAPHGAPLNRLQQAFHEEHGLQCGFCTPGMLMTCRALLDKNPDPTEGEIREAISGQICRCTGYTTIVRSIQWAADHRAGEATEPEPAGDFDAEVQEDKTRGAEGAPMTVEEHATTGSKS